ncbi:hypothetical protein Tsubulata_014355 [Turnera subulata]|uniref:Uncharacterized protein n=1 Tax=Turnera subulata TaxID=218843 RepID=A0A9Q0F4X1_9ROSI|nr:hypothetical protein Tsubulata_014355 [Turnera subulata]
MDIVFKVLFTVFFFSLVTQGNCQCPGASALSIVQNRTGKVVANKSQWEVTISNNCVCTQFDIYLACNGFHSVEKYIPQVLFQLRDGRCLVNGYGIVNGHQNFTFTYSWDQEFPFKPLKSRVICS